MTASPWSLVFLLSATATASYLCRVNMSVAGAFLMSEFSLSQVQMGWIFSAFLCGYALFQVPSGMLADSWGTRRVLSAASWAWVLLTMLQVSAGRMPSVLPWITPLGWLLFLRLLLGIAEAPTFPAAARGISRWFPPMNQGKANGLVIAAIGLGSALAPPLISTTMIHWGWRIALLISALPSLCVGLLWLIVTEKTEVISAVSGKTGRVNNLLSPGGMLRNRSFLLLTISYTLQGYVGYIFVFWFYLYLVQERHFDFLRGAMMSSLPWILSILSIPLGGLVSDRLVSGRAGIKWGRRIVPIFGLSASGLLLALGAHTQSAYLAAVYLALATALVLCVEGPFWAAMMEIAVSRTGTAGGIMNMGSNLGGLVSPALTPMLATYFGWGNSLMFAAALSVIAGVLWFWINPES